jgi:arsenate reductase
MMELELLYAKGCPSFREARKFVHDTVKSLGLRITLKKIEIKNESDLKRYSFPGSPTIRINGKDVEPDTAQASGLACRVYSNGGNLPDRDVLKCTIAKAAGFKTVLFVCTGNAVRSQIAEAVVNHFMNGTWVASSAGIMPLAINPDVIKVMKEIGIDMSGQRAKHIDVFRNCHFDRVITLCSDVDNACLNYPVADKRDCIIFHDPTSSYGFGFGSKGLFRSLRDDIRKTIIAHLENS